MKVVSVCLLLYLLFSILYYLDDSMKKRHLLLLARDSWITQSMKSGNLKIAKQYLISNTGCAISVKTPGCYISACNSYHNVILPTIQQRTHLLTP